MAIQKIVYDTPSGQRVCEARQESKLARKQAKVLADIPGAEEIHDGLLAVVREKESESWDMWTRARLEALTVYKDQVRRGRRTYSYWKASWRQGGKVHNVHLGSTENLDFVAATDKARKIKARFLGVDE